MERLLTDEERNAAWLEACRNNVALVELSYPEVVVKAQDKATLKAVGEMLEKEREKSRPLVQQALHIETRYRTRGKIAFINQMLKYLKRGEMLEEGKGFTEEESKDLRHNASDDTIG